MERPDRPSLAGDLETEGMNKDSSRSRGSSSKRSHKRVPSTPSTRTKIGVGQDGHSADSYEPDTALPAEVARPATADLRIATYNLRVDHHEDRDTVHEWSQRRSLVATAILGLAADVVAVQEPSPMQAADLQEDLGSDWMVFVTPCDPEAWEASPMDGPSDGECREGNGVIYRRSRLTLVDTYTFWLSSTPDRPSRSDTSAYDGYGSPYQRSCVVCTFLDKYTSQRFGVLSTRFDGDGDDSLNTGGSEARRRAATLVMNRAHGLLRTKGVEAVIVCGCALPCLKHSPPLDSRASLPAHTSRPVPAPRTVRHRRSVGVMWI